MVSAQLTLTRIIIPAILLLEILACNPYTNDHQLLFASTFATKSIWVPTLKELMPLVARNGKSNFFLRSRFTTQEPRSSFVQRFYKPKTVFLSSISPRDGPSV